MAESFDYNAKYIADWFVASAVSEKISLTHMKLQKLLYFAQGWYLANTSKALFYDNFEAWKFGPVLPNLYGQYKHHKGNPILDNVEKPSFDAEKEAYLQEFWSVFKGFDAIRLSTASHEAGGPWAQVYEESFNADIPVDLIESHFKAKLALLNDGGAKK